jgi:hypothetical protein
MATISPRTATEILGEVIEPLEPSFGGEFAQLLLRLRMSDRAQGQIRDLLQRNNAGSLDADARAVLDNYLLVGQFLDLLQAKARLALQDGGSST